MTLGADHAIAERERLGIGLRGPIPDLLGLIEDTARVPVIVARLGDDGVDGAYVVRRGEPFILINGSRPLVRCRFTLAHEYGHHRLRHGEQVDRAIDFEHGDAKEREANEFAATLLLPIEAIDWWMGNAGNPELDLSRLVALSAYFGVSAEVARIRLEMAGRLRGKQSARLAQAVATGEHRTVRLWHYRPLPETLRDAIGRERRLPGAAERLLVLGIERGLVSKAEASRRLRLSETQLSALAKSLQDCRE